MGVNASRTKVQYDVEPKVLLRNIKDGAETPSGSSVWEAGVTLDELRKAYWHNNEIPAGTFQIAVNVTAVNLSTNVYDIVLQVDDVVGFNNNPVAVGSVRVTGPGTYYIDVDAQTIPLVDPDKDGTGKYLRVGVTESGTPSSPSITYGAWIAKDLGL